jgi:ABC-type sugar transport system permease subunit
LSASDYRNLFIAITSGLIASTIQAFVLDKYLRDPSVRNIVRTVLIILCVIMLFFVFLTAMVWSDKRESRIYVVTEEQYQTLIANGRIENANATVVAFPGTAKNE